jgi:hypothetical protein
MNTNIRAIAASACVLTVAACSGNRGTGSGDH